MLIITLTYLKVKNADCNIHIINNIRKNIRTINSIRRQCNNSFYAQTPIATIDLRNVIIPEKNFPYFSVFRFYEQILQNPWEKMCLVFSIAKDSEFSSFL